MIYDVQGKALHLPGRLFFPTTTWIRALLVEAVFSWVSCSCSTLPRSLTVTQYSTMPSYMFVLRRSAGEKQNASERIGRGQKWGHPAVMVRQFSRAPTWSAFLSYSCRKPLHQRFFALGTRCKKRSHYEIIGGRYLVCILFMFFLE